jgi:hypothetical protein
MTRIACGAWSHGDRPTRLDYETENLRRMTTARLLAYSIRNPNNAELAAHRGALDHRGQLQAKKPRTQPGP